jgi:hypothetical protein
MTTPVAVSENDLRTMMRIVSDHRSDLPPTGLLGPAVPTAVDGRMASTSVPRTTCCGTPRPAVS